MTDRLLEELHRIACHLDLVARDRGLKRPGRFAVRDLTKLRLSGKGHRDSPRYSGGAPSISAVSPAENA